MPLRMRTELRKQVDAWASAQFDKPTRSEALRRLIELGLTVKRKTIKSLRPDQLNAENDG